MSPPGRPKGDPGSRRAATEPLASPAPAVHGAAGADAPATARPKHATAGTPKRVNGGAPKRGDASAPQLRLRMRVMAGEVIAIGPGKVALLEAIAVTGSLTGAAKHLGMSYRRAWVLLDELNRSLRTPAVDSAKGGEGGGGSELTDCGRELVALYRRIEDGARLACAADIRRLLGLVAR